MKTLKILLLLIAVIGSLSLTYAQKSWSLEDCINHALQNNIQLKRSELQVESAKRDLTQSTFQLGPDLSGSFYHQYINGTSLDRKSVV